MLDLKTLVEILLNDLSTIADETGCCPICGQDVGHSSDCSLDALERARDALRPLETEDAVKELRALREARETPLFTARVHRFSNQGGGR